jgi:hypothetical protein
LFLKIGSADLGQFFTQFGSWSDDMVSKNRLAFTVSPQGLCIAGNLSVSLYGIWVDSVMLFRSTLTGHSFLKIIFSLCLS